MKGFLEIRRLLVIFLGAAFTIFFLSVSFAEENTTPGYSDTKRVLQSDAQIPRVTTPRRLAPAVDHTAPDATISDTTNYVDLLPSNAFPPNMRRLAIPMETCTIKYGITQHGIQNSYFYVYGTCSLPLPETASIRYLTALYALENPSLSSSLSLDKFRLMLFEDRLFSTGTDTSFMSGYYGCDITFDKPIPSRARKTLACPPLKNRDNVFYLNFHAKVHSEWFGESPAPGTREKAESGWSSLSNSMLFLVDYEIPD